MVSCERQLNNMKQKKTNRFQWPRLGIAALALSAGCRTVPFDPVPLSDMRNRDPESARIAFADTLSPRFEWRHALTFEFPFRRMAALGVITGDREADSFALVAFTHTGVTLFEARSVAGTLETRFAIPEMAERPEIGEAIAEDARRMFFNLVPPSDAHVRRARRRLTYRTMAEEGRIEYDLGGAIPVLLEKRYRRGRRKDATIRYFEYRKEGKYMRPFGIVLDNHRRHYRLVYRALPADETE